MVEKVPARNFARKAGLLAVLLALLTGCGPTPLPTPAAGGTWTRPADGMVMVYVPPGEFLMGSTRADLNFAFRECPDCDELWFESEKPTHTVYLDAFWVDRTEVTNAQYRRCVEAGACPPPPFWEDDRFDAPDQPVVGVTWDDARAYCQWAGGRLPTEAEWEKAARGPDARLFPWGPGFAGGLANHCDRRCDEAWKEKTSDDGYTHTAPVGSYPYGASPYGALDMAGNAAEWVADRYDAGYYARSPRANPPGPEAGEAGIVRGGSWRTGPAGLRCARRVQKGLNEVDNQVGFRCVVPAEK